MIVAIIVYQILMIGVFGLKKNPTVSALSFPPLLFTITFKILIQLYFERVSNFMELDSQRKEEEERGEDAADEAFLQVGIIIISSRT